MRGSMTTNLWQQKLAPRVAPLKMKWHGLEAREKAMLTVLGLLVVICVFWFGIWQPVHDGVRNAEQRMTNAQNLSRYLDSRVARIQALQSVANNQTSNTSITSNALPGEVNRLANEMDLTITRVQTQGESRVLVLEEVSFQTLLYYIEALSNLGIMIEGVDVSAANEVGYVRVRKLQVRAAG